MLPRSSFLKVRENISPLKLLLMDKMTKFTGVCTVLLLSCSVGCIREGDSTSEDSLVKKLTAVCGKDGIKVSVRFSQPFRGIVYSDGHYDTPHCIFIDQEKNAKLSSVLETKFSFLIPADECGTKFHDPGSALSSQNDNTSVQPVNELANEVYMENTVMFQQNHFIQEQGDLAQTLRCVWQKEIRKPLHATLPLAVRGKHRQKLNIEKKQYLTVPSPSSPLATSALSRDFAKGYSYLTSSQQRHVDIRKKFQPKGQVESVTYGSSRRNGKSLALRAPADSELLQLDNDVLLLRTPSNFTALPYKADELSGATFKYPLLSLQSHILLLLPLLNLHWNFLFK